ncbi:transporter substrate-binding domain-containing protein [Desulfobacterales bacterium HSG17]|nr:transporter substrate-binding domain-containing protein [Desulfobacterales bacterium HSG17]
MCKASVYAAQPPVILADEEKAWLKDHPSITFGTSESLEPAVIKGENGRLSGILIDFFSQLNLKLGTEFSIETGKWSEILSKAEKGQIQGMLNISKPQAVKRGLVITHSHFTVYPTVFTHSDISSEITNLEDLKGKKVSILKNYLFAKNLLKTLDKITIIETDTVLDALKSVYERKTDAMMGYSFQNYLVSKYMLTGLVPTFMAMEQPMNSYMGIHPKFPMLVSILNKGIDSFTQAEINAVLSKWSAAPILKQADNIKSQYDKNLLSEDDKNWLKKHPDITLGFNDSMPPFLIKDKKGRLSGLMIDILNLLNYRLGTDINVRAEDWVEIQDKAANKEIDGILGMAPKLGDKLGLIKTHSYVKSYMTVFGRKDNSFKIESLKDLEGKNVSMMKGMVIPQILGSSIEIEKVNLIEADNIVEALRMVFEQKADAMIGISHNNYLITKEGFTGLIPVYFVRELPVDAVMGIRPDWPELVSILNKGIDSLTDAEINFISNKWVNIPLLKSTEISLTKTEESWLSDHPVIRVASDSNWAPIEFADGNGDYQGISPEYLKVIEKLLNIRFDIVPELSWTQLVAKVKNREVDMFSCLARTSERSNYLNFTRPYLSIPVVIFTKSNVTYINDLMELNGKKIAVVEGYAVQEWLSRDYPDIRLITTGTICESLERLVRGEVFAYVGNILTTSYYIRETGKFSIKVAGETPYSYDQTMAVRKDWPELVNILQKALNNSPFA